MLDTPTVQKVTGYFCHPPNYNVNLVHLDMPISPIKDVLYKVTKS